MKKSGALFLLMTGALLLPGCQPVQTIRVFNNTGSAIEVATDEGPITVADGADFRPSFVLDPHAPAKSGLSAKIAGRRYFYTFSLRKGQYNYALNSPPFAYWRHAGFNHLEQVYGLSRSGEVFALEPGTTSYQQNHHSQPAGFPLKPDA